MRRMVTGTRIIMGMPIIVEIVDRGATDRELDALWVFFTAVEAQFSTYREDSELSRINRGLLAMEDASPEMRAMIDRAIRTGDETNGYFEPHHTPPIAPSFICSFLAKAHRNVRPLRSRQGMGHRRGRQPLACHRVPPLLRQCRW